MKDWQGGQTAKRRGDVGRLILAAWDEFLQFGEDFVLPAVGVIGGARQHIFLDELGFGAFEAAVGVVALVGIAAGGVFVDAGDYVGAGID